MLKGTAPDQLQTRTQRREVVAQIVRQSNQLVRRRPPTDDIGLLPVSPAPWERQ